MLGKIILAKLVFILFKHEDISLNLTLAMCRGKLTSKLKLTSLIVPL